MNLAAFLFAALAVTALQSKTGGAPGLGWELTLPASEASEAELAFGVAGTDAVKAILRCRPRARVVTVSAFPETAPRRGKMVLSAGDATSIHPAHVEPNEAASGVLAQMRVPTSDPALRAFRRGAPLSIASGQERTDVPAPPPKLRTRFFRICGG